MGTMTAFSAAGFVGAASRVPAIAASGPRRAPKVPPTPLGVLQRSSGPVLAAKTMASTLLARRRPCTPGRAGGRDALRCQTRATHCRTVTAGCSERESNPPPPRRRCAAQHQLPQFQSLVDRRGCSGSLTPTWLTAASSCRSRAVQQHTLQLTRLPIELLRIFPCHRVPCYSKFVHVCWCQLLQLAPCPAACFGTY